MKHFCLVIICLLCTVFLKAQVYINSDVTIQNNATLYADDTVQLASSAVVTNNGILQSTKSINTNGYLINTGATGYIITPVASGSLKTYDIGTSSNNKIQIQHSTGSNVIFQMAVRDNVYLNPQTSSTQLTSNVVNKTWILMPQTSVANLSGTAYWNAADESSGFTRSNCGVSYWQSGSSTSWTYTNGTSAATITGSSPAYSKATSAAGLTAGTYYFGVGGLGSSLPVAILKFAATKNINDDVLLNWITSSEINNDHFEIQRSVDCIKFESIVQIKGAGNSNTEIQYSSIDKTPFAKLNETKLYYRLKQIDFDGKYQYTEIKEVGVQKMDANLNATNFIISTYPNPTTQLLNIDIETTDAKSISLSLLDANGKSLLSQQYQIDKVKQTFQLNTSQLAPGVYMLNILDENKTYICKQKLIIY